MVDVGDKKITTRMATAVSRVKVGEAIVNEVASGDLNTPKGPVFQTAILAGTMAAKKTADLIPLCHVIPLDSVKIKIETEGKDTFLIHCTAKATHKTGVEMEALTGASVAALTIYDMCKAMSHNIVLKNTQLMEKTGGKKDFSRSDA